MKSKKPYSKPKITKVELRPEEAVLSACKGQGASGPGDPQKCPSNCKQRPAS